MDYLLKLSDEYQVKLIFDPCIEFVKNERKTKENVMKIRKIAEMYNLDRSVRQACDDLLKDMKLTTLSETVHLDDLDRENVRYFLEQKIERLEAFLDKLYPQLLGVVECLVWLMKESGKGVDLCSEHVHDNGILRCSRRIDDREIRECPECCAMLYSLVHSAYYMRGRRRDNGVPESHRFNRELKSVIDDLCKLKHG